MEKHKLTVADEWFIKKGQVDSISRSHFSVGDEVVVCDRQHVMLAEFYDGECPTCHSKRLVQFSRENVEPAKLHTFVGSCPKCNRNATIIFSRIGNQPFIGRCPNCNKTISLDLGYFIKQKALEYAEHYIRTIHKIITFLLLLAIGSIVFMNYNGLISNDAILFYVKETVLPRSIAIFDKLKGCFWSEIVKNQFKESFILIVENTSVFFRNSHDVLVLILIGFQSVLFSIWDKSTRLFDNTCDMFRLFKIRTDMFFEYFQK